MRGVVVWEHVGVRKELSGGVIIEGIVHMHTRSHSSPHTHAHTHTHTHTHAHTRTHMHTHAHPHTTPTHQLILTTPRVSIDSKFVKDSPINTHPRAILVLIPPRKKG